MNYMKIKFNIVVLVAVILVVAAAIYLLFDKLVLTHSSTKLPPNVVTSTSPAANSLNNKRKSSSSPAVTLNTGPSKGSALTNVTLAITRASVVGNSLEVGTIINGASSGTCTLSASQSGQATLVRTDKVVTQNNSYVCPVFSIPVSQFPDRGNWNVSVKLIVNGSSYSAKWASNPVHLSGSY